MFKIKEVETRFTVGDSTTLTGTERENYHGYKICDGKLHHVKLSDMAIITGLNTNIFRLT